MVKDCQDVIKDNKCPTERANFSDTSRCPTQNGSKWGEIDTTNMRSFKIFFGWSKKQDPNKFVNIFNCDGHCKDDDNMCQTALFDLNTQMAYCGNNRSYAPLGFDGNDHKSFLMCRNPLPE